jgi:hypothetical protein
MVAQMVAYEARICVLEGLDKSRVYQSDIVTAVLRISQYVYVHHLNIYFGFCVDYHWKLVVIGWIFAYIILPHLLKLVGLATSLIVIIQSIVICIKLLR